MFRIISLIVVVLLLGVGCSAAVEESAETSLSMKSEQAAPELYDAVMAKIETHWPQFAVEVEVEANGRVTLAGTVPSEEVEAAIEEGVQSVPGVDRVRSRLQVASE